MKFMDWQVTRYGSVAIDVSYILFGCTDGTVRQRMPELLKIYYNELQTRISALGSDGTKLFPFGKFQWHMKTYSKFGFGN